MHLRTIQLRSRHSVEGLRVIRDDEQRARSLEKIDERTEWVLVNRVGINRRPSAPRNVLDKQLTNINSSTPRCFPEDNAPKKSSCLDSRSLACRHQEQRQTQRQTYTADEPSVRPQFRRCCVRNVCVVIASLAHWFLSAGVSQQASKQALWIRLMMILKMLSRASFLSGQVQSRGNSVVRAAVCRPRWHGEVSRCRP